MCIHTDTYLIRIYNQCTIYWYVFYTEPNWSRLERRLERIEQTSIHTVFLPERCYFYNNIKIWLLKTTPLSSVWLIWWLQ